MYFKDEDKKRQEKLEAEKRKETKRSESQEKQDKLEEKPANVENNQKDEERLVKEENTVVEAESSVSKNAPIEKEILKTTTVTTEIVKTVEEVETRVLEAPPVCESVSPDQTPEVDDGASDSNDSSSDLSDSDNPFHIQGISVVDDVAIETLFNRRLQQLDQLSQGIDRCVWRHQNK